MKQSVVVVFFLATVPLWVPTGGAWANPQSTARLQNISVVTEADTYDEQRQQCENALQQSMWPIGTKGYAAIYDSCQTLENQALQREVGNLISQGRCPDAVALALRAGQLQLAVNARAFCGSGKTTH